MRFLVTGTAGFIGYHLAERLLGAGHTVFGIDAFTPYYDLSLKRGRAALLGLHPDYRAAEIPLEEADAVARVVAEAAPDVVIHLAAQAGVRYSLDNPRAYLDANTTGTFNLLEAIRGTPVRHFLLASTSSVYGCNPSIPFRETDQVDHPLTFYAATKRSTELMAHSYAHLWDLPTTSLRFFTVYGPWGRPDMAPLKFLDAIEQGRPIQVYNHGRMSRDFTYIADIVESVVRLADCIPPRVTERSGAVQAFDSLSPVAPYRVVNVGGGAPVDLMRFVALMEAAVGKSARRNYVDMQQGDVPITFADTTLLESLTRYRPTTQLADGIAALVAWYRAHQLRASLVDA